jgi:monoamine oxidase
LADYPTFAVGTRLQHLLDDVVTETSAALFRLEGGMDQLAVRLAGQVRGTIRLECPIEGVHVEPDGVRVEVRERTGTVSRNCDYVVCTVPFSVLRTLRLSGIDADKLAIIDGMQYWPATKVAVHCREAFWKHGGISGGGSFTGGLVGQTYYPMFEHDPRLGATLLASYTIGPDTAQLAAVPAHERASVVIEELSRIHPELAEPGMVLGSVVQAWGEDPYSRGAAPVRWGREPAAAEEERLRAAEPQGRLFFAGDHCSAYPAWIEGAIESGMSAAQGIDAHRPTSVAMSAGCDATGGRR